MLIMRHMLKQLGRAGIVASLLLWIASVLVLGMLMRAIAEASSRVATVLWAVLFVALQLAGPLVLGFTLRAAYRWRAAVCFTFGAGCGMLLDAFGMFGMLLWLRFHLGAG